MTDKVADDADSSKKKGQHTHKPTSPREFCARAGWDLDAEWEPTLSIDDMLNRAIEQSYQDPNPHYAGEEPCPCTHEEDSLGESSQTRKATTRL